MPAPQGGLGQSWFVLNFEAAFTGGGPWTALTLDTSAPAVTFGIVDGAEAGSLLQIAYVVDEGSVEGATVTFTDDATP